MDLTLRNDKDEVIFLNNMEIKFNEKKIKKGNEIAFLVKDDNYELVSNTTHTIVMNIATIVVMVVFMLHTLFIKKQNDIERKSKRNNTTYEQL